MNVTISRPQRHEEKAMTQFFDDVITHTFKAYGYYEKYKQDIEYEVGKQTTALQQDFDSNGKRTYFLIAKDGNNIIGTIAYGPVNSDITKYYKDASHHIPEIKSLYVLPAYQGKGIGTKLFNEILVVLQENGVDAFYLESGYPKAQQFWKNKLGDPVKTVFDRWDAGNDYMIWQYKL